MSDRREFRFVEYSLNARHRQYLTEAAGRKGVWILVDTNRATGCEFRNLPNDVVVTTGPNGHIPRQSILSIGKD